MFFLLFSIFYWLFHFYLRKGGAVEAMYPISTDFNRFPKRSEVSSPTSPASIPRTRGPTQTPSHCSWFQSHGLLGSMIFHRNEIHIIRCHAITGTGNRGISWNFSGRHASSCFIRLETASKRWNPRNSLDLRGRRGLAGLAPKDAFFGTQSRTLCAKHPELPQNPKMDQNDSKQPKFWLSQNRGQTSLIPHALCFLGRFQGAESGNKGCGQRPWHWRHVYENPGCAHCFGVRCGTASVSCFCFGMKIPELSWSTMIKWYLEHQINIEHLYHSCLLSILSLRLLHKSNARVMTEGIYDCGWKVDLATFGMINQTLRDAVGSFLVLIAEVPSGH